MISAFWLMSRASSPQTDLRAPLHAPISGQTNCRIIAIQGGLVEQLQLLRG